MRHCKMFLLCCCIFVLSGLIPFFSVFAAEHEWESFITAKTLKGKFGQSEVLIIDVRSSEEYVSGHIPLAINLPGKNWRTPKVRPGQGDSQYIFRRPNGALDITHYESFLSSAGVMSNHNIVIYGNHGGKADGSLPAMILHWLGHKQVAFLDGVGIERWKAEGYSISMTARSLSRSRYVADPMPNYVWKLKEVLSHIGSADVVFYDTRTKAEFRGNDKRGNMRSGHIPGAVLLDYKELLDSEANTVRPRKNVRSLLEDRGLTRNKYIVLYCQTATRVSLPALMLRDLGYPRVAVYDASWHEYGNRRDTPVETCNEP